MGSYWYPCTTFIWALLYLSMTPLLILAPEFFFKVLLFDADLKYHTVDNVKMILAVFLSLAVVVAPTYIIAALKNYTAFIHITIAQRLTVVLATILITGMVIKQDVFEFGNFTYTMFLFADIVPCSIKGFLAPYEAPGRQPNGYTAIKDSIKAMFWSTPVDSYKKSLRLESYIGMAFGFIACIYASIVSDVKLSLVTTMIVSILPYFWTWFIAHEPSFTSYFLLMIQRVAITATLLFFVFVFDFGVMNIVYIIQAVNILSGIISSNIAALVLSLSSLFVFKLECDYILTLESPAPFYWLTGWSILTIASSYLWIFIFNDGYDDHQQARLSGTHWQDKILACFGIGIAGTLTRADFLRPGTIGAPLVYILPVGMLWLTLESKMLTHLWVGTPFHTSWWLDGDPKLGQTPRYAANHWINVSFSLAITVTTITLTTYAWFAINKSVGFESFGLFTKNDWKFAVTHGVFFIFHSGLWMILASSGVPALTTKGFLSKFPPSIPPPLPCDSFMCKKIHKVDLVVGHIFLFGGAFWLGDGSNEDSPQLLATKGTAIVAWIFSIAYKIYVHIKYPTSKEPFLADPIASTGKKTN